MHAMQCCANAPGLKGVSRYIVYSLYCNCRLYCVNHNDLFILLSRSISIWVDSFRYRLINAISSRLNCIGVKRTTVLP